ncbi:MAG TPA: 4Fe-4S binding protein [Vicinamibacterales bacterium]|nr:4Fe-4S binding protein [Vicinamibacterales bacterium]
MPPAGETWHEILAPQAIDLAVLALFIGVALTSFFLKSKRLKYVALVFAVGYMGFMKSHLLSVVDIFGVIAGDLPVVKYNISYYVFGVFVVASTVLWGRLYCGRICAFGALTQVMDAVLPAGLRVDVPDAIERRAAWIKYGLLAFVVVYFVATRNLLVYQYVEPFWMFSLFGTRAMWIGLGVLLVATVFVRNLYCRFLCPVGAMLGLISTATVFKIKRWSECKTCKICEKTCEWGAIRGPVIVKTECVRCDDCERLYLDQKRCPHWLIQIRRASPRRDSVPGPSPGDAHGRTPAVTN